MTASAGQHRIGPIGAFYGVYAITLFAVCAVCALIGVILVPGLERRRRWTSAWARAPFLLSGITVDCRGTEQLPLESCVVVANHASYVDGMLLQGFLPTRFSYVIKGEMQRVPGVAFLLRRIGARFVDRNDRAAGARDIRNLMRAAGDGESLVFFPEGTFVAQPGLRAFRPGAFMAAKSADVPIVPLAISGTRRLLPAKAILPRRQALTIDVLAPIQPDDEAYADRKTLTELARERVLTVLDEPDMGAFRITHE